MLLHGEISATYTNGVLKPDERIDLPEGARVTVSRRDPQPTAESRRRGWETIERIRREGLIRSAATAGRAKTCVIAVDTNILVYAVVRVHRTLRGYPATHESSRLWSVGATTWLECR